MNEKTRTVLMSKKTDEWGTPQDLYNRLNLYFNFTLDPCSTKENHKCEKYFTTEANGLRLSWANEVVFCNPPYSQIKKWVQKAVKELDYSCNTIMLIPARVDTKIFQDYVFKFASTVCFIRGRLRFINIDKKNNTAPFPSALIVFSSKTYSESLKDVDFLSQLGYSFNIKLQ